MNGRNAHPPRYSSVKLRACLERTPAKANVRASIAGAIAGAAKLPRPGFASLDGTEPEELPAHGAPT